MRFIQSDHRFMRRFLPLMMVLPLALVSVSRGQAAPGANPPPTKLAVVNIPALSDGLDEARDAEADMTKMLRTFEDESSKMQEDIKQRQKEIDSPTLFSKTSPEYKKLQEEQLQKTVEFQIHDQVAKQKFTIEKALRSADLYKKMNQAINDYAQANGIAFVFSADDINALSIAETPEQLRAMITQRKLVYFHPTFDITKAIISKMNDQYKLGASNKSR